MDELNNIPVTTPKTRFSWPYQQAYNNQVRLNVNQLKDIAVATQLMIDNLQTQITNDNKQSDWNQTDNTKIDYILNKPAFTTPVNADWNSTTGLSQILNKPVLFDGNYNSLINKPNLFNGDYNNLTNKPTYFNGDYNNLTNKPIIPATQIQSNWTQSDNTKLDFIKNKPVLFSGSYTDLTNKPSFFDGNYNNLTNKPILFDGNYTSLTNKPTIPNNTAQITETTSLYFTQTRARESITATTPLNYNSTTGVLSLPLTSFAPALLFSQTETKTVSGVLTETSLLGNGVGTKTLTANSLIQGKTILIKGNGFLSTGLISLPNINLRLKLGGTLLVQTGTVLIVGLGQSNAGFDFEILLTCQSIDVNNKAVIRCQGVAGYSSVAALNLSNRISYGMTQTTPVLIDPSIAQTFDITFQWGLVTLGSTITITNLYIQTLN